MNNYGEADVQDCTFSFKCPQKWEKMEATESEDVRLCNVCKRKVYFAGTKEKWDELSRTGKCVAIVRTDPRMLRPMVTAGIPLYDPERQMNKRVFIECRKCGTNVLRRDKFCGRCGTAIKVDG